MEEDQQSSADEGPAVPAESFAQHQEVDERRRLPMNSRSDSMSLCLTTSRPSLLHLGSAAASSEKLDDGAPFRASSTPPAKVEESEDSRKKKTPGTGGMVSPEHSASQPDSKIAVTGSSAKATTFHQLKQKYLSELEYMLTEFQKLERQLLGAKAATRESAGSKERREKLHSFISHLDDTIKQIQAGCKSEAETKSSGNSKGEEGEIVLKLEEHILANLLPVKVRLKKQLAAQQGAKHNPASMPVRGGMSLTGEGPATAAVNEAKATFVTQAKPVDSQFCKPLADGCSFLTQKLHGSTLGSKTPKPKPSSKVLYAGMAIGSDQIESSVLAANSAHHLVIKNPALLELSKLQFKEDTPDLTINPDLISSTETKQAYVPAEEPSKPAVDALEQQRIRHLRRKKRKRKKQLELLQKQKTQAEPSTKKRKQAASHNPKKRGPRAVEYICALCNEVYQSFCEYNTWWALEQQECPKCRKGQIPRIDISAPSNAIEYHPALLAHAEDGGVSAAAALVEPIVEPTPQVETDDIVSDGSDSLGSDLTEEDWEGLNSDDDSPGSSDSEALVGMSAPEVAERERFGVEYTGPICDDEEASRLLILMGHASTCLCQHKSSTHREVCRSTKYMMLHVRDCPGTTSMFDVCPFPWCRKVKHLLYHLVTCQEQEYCSICNPTDLSNNFSVLRGLNEHRFGNMREHLVAKAKTTAETRAIACFTKPTDPEKQPSSNEKLNGLASERVEEEKKSSHSLVTGLDASSFPQVDSSFHLAHHPSSASMDIHALSNEQQLLEETTVDHDSPVMPAIAVSEPPVPEAELGDVSASASENASTTDVHHAGDSTTTSLVSESDATPRKRTRRTRSAASNMRNNSDGAVDGEATSSAVQSAN